MPAYPCPCTEATCYKSFLPKCSLCASTLLPSRRGEPVLICVYMLPPFCQAPARACRVQLCSAQHTSTLLTFLCGCRNPWSAERAAICPSSCSAFSGRNLPADQWCSRTQQLVTLGSRDFTSHPQTIQTKTLKALIGSLHLLGLPDGFGVETEYRFYFWKNVPVVMKLFGIGFLFIHQQFSGEGVKEQEQLPFPWINCVWTVPCPS